MQTVAAVPAAAISELFSDMPRAFDFDDVSLVPRLPSTLAHRTEALPAVNFGPVPLTVPLIGSPMPDVCGVDMCQALGAHGALGVLPRFQPVDEQAAQLRVITTAGGPLAAALGVTGDYRERFAAIVEAGCRIVCLDTANGAHQQVGNAVRWVRNQDPAVFLIAGNVATAETFRWLEDQGVDAIRVGIAGGSVCETRTETGVHAPTPYSVHECAQVRRHALIVADGGIRSPADMCKLLAFGADAVMVGSALAGTYEAPGRVIVVDGKKFKIMRGAASFSVQQEFAGEDPEYIEGAESIVAYKGRVADVLQRYVAGLRSSMSYMDARTLDEYRSNASFIRMR
jgi:IMP dehydrogenase